MLSKKEVEAGKQCLKDVIVNTYAEGKAIKLENLYKYIEELEAREQELIEKLEEVIQDDEMSDTEYQLKRELAKEILAILKGEKEV